ncbi:elongation factor 1 beta/delta chain [Rhodotorula toruloides]|uniref:Elongation factor 1-beta n=1 Tax=Rhodotorula toruloides TaxID=5286 RepID=A0A2T0A1I5_RHOTO|nr:elongation factor 1 beta/delta chain [Rhodotorula toruloides]
MGFPEFTNPAGLQSLEAHLADKSYIEGYTPSQADVAVYKALASAPDAATYPRSARWFKHIQSYEAEHETLPGDASKPASAYGSAVAAAAAPAAAEDEDDIDLFGSDDEEVDPEAEALKQKRLAEYAAKKANKPKTIAKSLVTLDVKPWDDETDMAQLEANVRAIEKPGLVWGLSKLVPIGYGIKKLQMSLVVEDELVSLDELQDQIAEDEEHVQVGTSST